MSQSDRKAPATSTDKRQYVGASSLAEYELMEKLGEGTFGEVHKALNRRSGALVALKKIIMHNEKDGFPITALREIKLLKMLSHVNILKLDEMAVQRFQSGRKRAVLYTVTPYMEHDLSGLLDNPEVRFTEPQIKCYMLQLLEGLRYLHDSHILHRDMKAANLLINNNGILQIADFGLARHYDEAVPRAGCGGGDARRDYTALVVTRWYRPPELLLGLKRYTTAIDLWGAGCVFGEMFKRRPILAGTSDLNQAQIIFELVGSPNNKSMPGWEKLPGFDGVTSFGHSQGSLPQVFHELDPLAISLLNDLLKLDWRKRVNAIDALKHPYFEANPKPARPMDLPRFQDSHELDRRNTRGQRGPMPPAPAGGTVGMGPNGEYIGHPAHTHAQNWGNGDRPPRGGMPHERGTHSGYRGYDSRGPPHHSRNHGRQGEPYRQQYPGRYEPAGVAQRNPLPLPPGEGRHPLPPNPQQNRGPPPSRVDTYIPSYGDNSRAHEDRSSRERDDANLGVPREGRRGSRDSGDGRPHSRGERGRRDDRYWDRDRAVGDRRDVRERHETRSRSPDRGHRDRAKDRQRERDRERDIYRR